MQITGIAASKLSMDAGQTVLATMYYLIANLD